MLDNITIMIFQQIMFGVMQKWKPRIRGHENVIGRMHSVNMKDTDRYFLRLLLLHVKGATSYDDLYSIEGNEYSTFLNVQVLRLSNR